MKAISVKNPYAAYILNGDKTIECRSWQTKYRGDLLICSSAKPEIDGMTSGHAVCVVTLCDIEEFRECHLKEACFDEMPEKKKYAWHLTKLRRIKMFPVKGRLSLFEVDDNLIEFI